MELGMLHPHLLDQQQTLAELQRLKAQELLLQSLMTLKSSFDCFPFIVNMVVNRGTNTGQT
jgi:hypothetical protein